jgi:sulfur carrier protein ThiS
MLFKFHADEAVELSFHSQSKASEMELKEKITLSDFLNEYETNKYQVHVKNG